MPDRKDDDYPGNPTIEPKWAFTVVFAAVVALIFKAAQKPEALNVQLIGEGIVAVFTGLWYWIRYHYTESATPRQKSFTSHLFTVIIGVTGITCIPAAGWRFWFTLHAAVLFLGTEKDCEIIRHQRRCIKDLDPKKGLDAIMKAKLLIFHHHYSIVRDVSMGFWWLIYGTNLLYWKVSPIPLIALFGIPYVVLVIAWCNIKYKTFYAERELAKWAQNQIYNN